MARGIQQVVEQFKPCAAMVATQCIFAAMTLWVKAAFRRGMSPMVFVVYRQAVATLVLAPITLMARRTNLKEVSPGTRGFFLVFVAALIGATVNQNLCYQGLHLGSSSLATTMTNMIPAITFAMAVAVGQERVNIREISSIAKIFGTIVCVGGAATLAFFKGPRLLKTNSLGDSSMFLHTLGSKWVTGALLLIVSSSCWSLWLILQGPICKSYMDPLTLSTWTCFLSTLQSAAVAFFLLPDQSAWRIRSIFELSCYIFAGVFGSGVNFYLQSWCISVRGPLYSAMFTPLCTVLTTVLATVVLHEELHVGSVIGAVAIVLGLYVVLWGKAEDARKAAPSANAQLDPEMNTTLAAPLMAATHHAQETNLTD